MENHILEAHKKLNIKPPRPNGGLFTGETFHEGAPYANIPVVPDSGYLIHYNLRSANPPKEALYQYPSTLRPGNNTPIQPGVGEFAQGKYDLYCISPYDKDQIKCSCCKCRSRKYCYL